MSVSASMSLVSCHSSGKQVTEDDPCTLTIGDDVITISNLPGAFAIELDRVDRKPAMGGSFDALIAEYCALKARLRLDPSLDILAKRMLHVGLAVALRVMYDCDQYCQLRG